MKHPLDRCPRCGGLAGARYGQTKRFGDKFTSILGHRRDCTTKEAKERRAAVMA